jgi:hypothetical protein
MILKKCSYREKVLSLIRMLNGVAVTIIFYPLDFSHVQFWLNGRVSASPVYLQHLLDKFRISRLFRKFIKLLN